MVMDTKINPLPYCILSLSDKLIVHIMYGSRQKSWFKSHTLRICHNKSHFWTVCHLHMYSNCGCILIVPRSLLSCSRRFMAPIKINPAVLLSLRPRKHEKSKQCSSSCVKFFSTCSVVVLASNNHVFKQERFDSWGNHRRTLLRSIVRHIWYWIEWYWNGWQ
jgi:hypothetical protein